MGELDKIKFLAFLGASGVRGEVGVHEGFEVGAVPLGQGGVDGPVGGGGGVAGRERAGGGEAFVQTGFEAGDFFLVVVQVVAWSGGGRLAGEEEGREVRREVGR